jgi:hypothetical protein
VIFNAAGPFGYSTTSGTGDSPLGSSLSVTITMGLPQSQSNPQIYNAYTPTLAQYTLQLSRSQS